MFSIKKVLSGTTSLVLVFGMYTGMTYAGNLGKTMSVAVKVPSISSTDSTSSRAPLHLSRPVETDIPYSSDRWYKIMYNDNTASVHNNYLSIKSNEPAADNTGKVTTETLNIRSEPNTDALVVTTLKKGQTVSILEHSGVWYKITGNGINGWVHGDFLSVDDKKPNAMSLSSAPVKKEKPAAANTGKVTTETLNIRSEPNTDALVVTTLKKGQAVTVLEHSGVWYKITCNGAAGWVHSDFLNVGDASAIKESTFKVSEKKLSVSQKSAKSEIASASGTYKVITDVLNVRREASTEAEIVTKLERGQTVTISARSGNWYKVKTSKGTTGWAVKDFLTIQKTQVSRGSSTERKSSNTVKASGKGEQIVGYAKNFLGVPYKWGGTSPSGFDCSGLVYYVYKHYGIRLQRVAVDQASQGVAVKKSELKPGDLVFFDTEGSNNGDITHVGIYIGGGKFIHAPNSRSDVKITSLSDSFYTKAYVRSRRIVN